MPQDITNNELATKIDDLARIVQTEFTTVREEIHEVDRKVGVLDERVNALDQKVEMLDEKVETLDQKMELLDEKVTRIDLRTAHQVDANYERAGLLEKRVDRIETHVGLAPATKAT